jgi:galactokinase
VPTNTATKEITEQSIKNSTKISTKYTSGLFTGCAIVIIAHKAFLDIKKFIKYF